MDKRHQGAIIATAAAALLVAAGVGHQLAGLQRAGETLAPDPAGGSKRYELQQCLDNATLVHDVRWAGACAMLAERDGAKHAACLSDSYALSDPIALREFCDKTFGVPDGSTECTLPDAHSARLHALLNKAEDECRAEARMRVAGP
jgi:hypothetical protein